MIILTGNELLSGATVYLDAQDAWVDDIDQARLFKEDEAEQIADLLKRAAETGRIVSLDQENVDVVDGKIQPNRLRERIRANGPTTPKHVVQHLKEGDHVSL